MLSALVFVNKARAEPWEFGVSAQTLSSADDNAPSIANLRVYKLWEVSYSEGDVGTAHCSPGELKEPHLGLLFIERQDDCL